jgi:hypothetical protein
MLKKKRDYSKYAKDKISVRIPPKWNLKEIQRDLGLGTTDLTLHAIAEYLTRRGYSID